MVQRLPVLIFQFVFDSLLTVVKCAMLRMIVGTYHEKIGVVSMAASMRFPPCPHWSQEC
jgi:hypothetical protein